jgi:ABC-type transport system substrate-binding protein
MSPRAWRTIDPRTYEVKLRPGVKFHGAREVTAEDVKYTLERFRTPRSQSRSGAISVRSDDEGISDALDYVFGALYGCFWRLNYSSRIALGALRRRIPRSSRNTYAIS